jgi:hypothetical protein
LASSDYQTLGNIRSAVLADFKESTGTQIVALVDRWINEGQENVILRRKRDYLNKTFHIALEADVQTTFNVTNGSATVSKTGTSALPITSLQEHKFVADGFQEVYDVLSFTSTSITLASPYLGTTTTNVSGHFFQSSVLLDPEIRSVWKVYHDYNNSVVDLIGAEELRSMMQMDPGFLDYAQYASTNGLDLNTGANQIRLEMWPFPKRAYTLHVDTNLFIPQLSTDSDEPLIHLQHRQILYWYGIYKMALYHNDQARMQVALANYNTWLSKLDGEFNADQGFPHIQPDRDRWIGRTNLRGRGKIYFVR